MVNVAGEVKQGLNCGNLGQKCITTVKYDQICTI